MQIISLWLTFGLKQDVLLKRLGLSNILAFLILCRQYFQSWILINRAAFSTLFETHGCVTMTL